jgi:transcriptional regulator with XRE-family HTH domain
MVEPIAFGQAVRQLRLAKGWTQPALAERAGVSKGMVSLIETGRRIPSGAVVGRMALALRLPHHVYTALLSVGGYASYETLARGSLELRAYLNSLDAPGDENTAPPRVADRVSGTGVPRNPQRG